MANVPRYIVIGLGIRLLLIPFHHPWDLQTFYNMFVDLATGRSPYDTFRDLMHFERSFFLLGANGTLYRQVFSTPFFEYYAYPPSSEPQRRSFESLLNLKTAPCVGSATRHSPPNRRYTPFWPMLQNLTKSVVLQQRAISAERVILLGPGPFGRDVSRRFQVNSEVGVAHLA